MMNIGYQSEQKNKEIKRIKIEKGEVKLLLLVEDTVPYISDAKNSTRECLQLIDTLINSAGNKIN